MMKSLGISYDPLSVEATTDPYPCYRELREARCRRLPQ